MADMRETDRRIAAIARRQFGLVGVEQLRAAGVSRSTTHRRVTAGRLLRAGPGVYAVAGSPRSWPQTALAACLVAGPDAALSHHSAGQVWGLDVPATPTIHLTVPHGRNARRPSSPVTVHRSLAWSALDRVNRHGLPVTGVARTLFDLASVLERDQLAPPVDGALARRMLTPGQLAATSERLASGRRHAAARLRTLLEPWCEGRVLDSAAEARAHRAFAAAGLPSPAVQHEVAGARARTDFAWPAEMVVLEVDGFRWHANPAAHARDSARANRLAAEGWTVLRATPAELADDLAGVVAALRRHLVA